MPKRTDIKKILLIGSGPIIIGQACEFDYSGTQACKALKEEGYSVVLVNSNPATIMTDPSVADKTYIEPLTPEFVEKIIIKERPDAILPTLGGQTALNLAMTLHRQGVLDTYKVQMLGASPEVIDKAEDRKLFKQAILKLGLDLPKSEVVYTIEDAKRVAAELGFPCIVRPSFTMGGTGGGIVYNMDELEKIAFSGIKNSLISEVLIEESILGWKEYELEVMRDRKDNVIIICSIENLDPMGVHTGDSVTVAPAQTLTDKEYQIMRDASLRIIREIGVETGGSNIQFAINPKNGRMIVIEMNPRVSRSSALASKATGFPIAKFAAKLAVGYTLDEIQNDITQKTPACFEPSIDYCVVKIPRFNFEKFRQSREELGVMMQSVGEVMAIGRTFKEALQKGLRSLEIRRYGLGFDGRDYPLHSEEALISKMTTPNSKRLFYIGQAMEQGMSVEKIHSLTQIDPWFLNQMQQIVTTGQTLKNTPQELKKAKQLGFSDRQIAHILKLGSETEARALRKRYGITPTYKLVDTCAAEFEAYTPYFYSCYEQEDEARISSREKVMILGGGPNRIGQGIEFDYCCVHASMAIRDLGLESIMVNSNPETVSTDFDISDKLYFEPLTVEDVLNIYERENPKGVIVQFGGQTPLNLAKQLSEAGVRILGTSVESIDRAEDRDLFQKLIQKLNLNQPENGMAHGEEEALQIARRIGYPVLVRPSYVLGGASMEIVYSDQEVSDYIHSKRVEVSPHHPVLIDQFLESAIEIDVDALSDGKNCVIAGIMEHIEEAGIHSGDSASVLPPHSISKETIEEIRKATVQIAKELNVIGLLNIQFAIQAQKVYVLEVNPRASRTVPFVSKVTGTPWAKMATQVMLGKTLQELGVKEAKLKHTAVKEAVFPFNKFPSEDVILGPEMKSTGEVMGIDLEFPDAYIKSQIAAGQKIQTSGTVFISLRESDKTERAIAMAKELEQAGFKIVATRGTAQFLEAQKIRVQVINKVNEGRPNVVDDIINGSIQMVINSPSGKYPRQDESVIRQTALSYNIPVITTLAGAVATVKGIRNMQKKELTVGSIQECFESRASAS